MAILRLVPFSDANADLVLGWRNAVGVRGNMIDDSVISRADHQKFLKNLETDSCRSYFVVYLGERPVAALYFTGLGQPEVTWGCYIGTERMVPGLFVALFLIATDFAFAGSETRALCSEVAEHNSAPLRFNRFAGLEAENSYMRTTRSGRQIGFQSYRVEPSQLSGIRSKALKVMPGSMKQAYNEWKVEN